MANWLDRLFNRSAPQAQTEIKEPVRTPFTFPIGYVQDGVEPLVDYAAYNDEGYARNAVVYACIRRIADAVPSARIQVRKNLRNSQVEPLEDHRLQALLEFPNPRQSMRTFLDEHAVYKNLAGNSYIVKERGRSGGTEKLWLARPDRMRPVVDRRSLLGFVYVAESGERIPFLPEEIIHDKYPNPHDPYEGMGQGLPPLSSAAYETDVDNSATSFTRSFFKNGAVIYGLLKVNSVLDDPEVARLRGRIRSQYTGEQNWHEMMILDADAEYQAMGTTMDKMLFPDLRAISETRICAAFMVPPVLVGVKAGLDSSTYSNYSQARRALWEDKLVPDLDKLGDLLTLSFRDELGDDTEIGFDYSRVVALADDRNNRFGRAGAAYAGGWITLNEARREVGLQPLADGDQRLQPLYGTGVNTPGNRGDLAPGSPDTNPKPDLTPKPASDAVTAESRKKEMPDWEAWAGGVWKGMDRTARAYELRFYEAAGGLFRQDMREIEAIINSQRVKTKKEIPHDELIKLILGYLEMQSVPGWALTFEPLMLEMLNEQGEEWATRLPAVFDFNDAQARAWLNTYSLKFASKLGETTIQALRGVLDTALAEGWGFPKLIDEVRAVYSGWTTGRAEAIARSETIRASNAGAEQAFRQLGVTQKQWYTAEDERVCPFCGKMHKTVVGVEQNYWNYGDEMVITDSNGQQQALKMDYEAVGYPPLHPQCRCTILPVVVAP